MPNLKFSSQLLIFSTKLTIEDQMSYNTRLKPKRKTNIKPKKKHIEEKEEEYEPPKGSNKRLGQYLTRDRSCKSKNNRINVKEEEFEEEKEESEIYEENSEDDDDDDEIDSPIVKKLRVQKYYEPIEDGNRIYRYADDPYEYKRARKRIQNRESATRVRNRKKVTTVELRQKVGNLEHEIVDLKSQNASLNTENSMLRQQMLFLEKVLIEHQKERGKEYDSFLMFSPNMD